MKKKLPALLCAVLAAVLLIPIPLRLKDGGSVEYRALVYSVKKVHALAPIEELQQGKEYREGLIIELLGVEIFNDVH